MSLQVDIDKSYGSFHLHVEFDAGWETMALLGASGCGKSLTLKCIAGIEKPDRGRIVLDDRVLYDSREGICLPPQKRRVGYLFQQYALFPNMTVEENIAAGAHHLKSLAREDRVAELLEVFQLEDTAGKLPHQLSGGQQQRVALARILASEPEVILLDEPFSSLDSYLKWQLERELQNLLKWFGGTILWVSHDRGEVFRCCDRVCVIDNGRSLPVHRFTDFLQNPGTVGAAQLMGYQTFTELRPTDDPGNLFLPEWMLYLKSDRPWRPGCAFAGFRPESIHLANGEENQFRCQVVGVTEDLSAMRLLLMPEKAIPDAPPLHMELPKEQYTGDKTLLVAVSPSDIVPLQSY